MAYQASCAALLHNPRLFNTPRVKNKNKVSELTQLYIDLCTRKRPKEGYKIATISIWGTTIGRKHYPKQCGNLKTTRKEFRKDALGQPRIEHFIELHLHCWIGFMGLLGGKAHRLLQVLTFSATGSRFCLTGMLEFRA